jgi:hypothetical protein
MQEGSPQAREDACSCIRQMALDIDSSRTIARNPGLLQALVTLLGSQNRSLAQRAAAALGNLAWRSTEARETIVRLGARGGGGGAAAGLCDLACTSEGGARESALAAMSNLSLHHDAAVYGAGAPGFLSLLAGELAAGSDKGKLRS